jgi:predicted RNase H-like HicB family nuclease
MRTYTIVIVPDDGIYAVFVPALPGCVTQGSTVDEAITGHIAALEAIGEDIPEESAPAHLAVIAISTPALQLAG